MSPNVKTTSNWIITSWFMTREEIEKRLDELARKYIETHDPEIVEELYKLASKLEKMEKSYELRTQPCAVVKPVPVQRKVANDVPKTSALQLSRSS